jgi:hypothetical protein
VSDGAAKSVPISPSADDRSLAGVCCCLTFAAARDRVPSRCGMPTQPTASQGRAGANSNWCAQRILRKAQRALAVALTGVGESVDPHRRRTIVPCSIVAAIIGHDLVHFALLT